MAKESELPNFVPCRHCSCHVMSVAFWWTTLQALHPTCTHRVPWLQVGLALCWETWSGMVVLGVELHHILSMCWIFLWSTCTVSVFESLKSYCLLWGKRCSSAFSFYLFKYSSSLSFYYDHTFWSRFTAIFQSIQRRFTAIFQSIQRRFTAIFQSIQPVLTIALMRAVSVSSPLDQTQNRGLVCYGNMQVKDPTPLGHTVLANLIVGGGRLGWVVGKGGWSALHHPVPDSSWSQSLIRLIKRRRLGWVASLCPGKRLKFSIWNNSVQNTVWFSTAVRARECLKARTDRPLLCGRNEASSWF